MIKNNEKDFNNLLPSPNVKARNMENNKKTDIIMPDLLASENENALKVQDKSASIILFSAEDNKIRIETRLQNNTVWLSQKNMAQLFNVSTSNINKHLNAIFKDEELQELAVIEEYSITASDGKHYKTKFYSLEAIIHVGYRVRSSMGAMFRAWATERLTEYMVKGFTMDDDKLKYNDGYEHYFEELLTRIRDIRSSEKMFYQKVRDVIARSSMDYEQIKKEQHVKDFFAKIQNYMLYASTKQTAAELIYSRADATKLNMGLSSFRDAVVKRADTQIAKNYLTSTELETLNQLVTMFLDFAELRAKNRQETHLSKWIEQAERFLTFNDMPVLQGKGKINHDSAVTHAKKLFSVYKEQLRAQELIAAEQEALAEITQSAKDTEHGKNDA